MKLMKLSKVERLEIYKKCLEQLLYDKRKKNYSCFCFIFDSILRGKGYSFYPLVKMKPALPEVFTWWRRLLYGSGYWWPTNYKGNEIRIRIITKVIRELSN